MHYRIAPIRSTYYHGYLSPVYDFHRGLSIVFFPIYAYSIYIGKNRDIGNGGMDGHTALR